MKLAREQGLRVVTIGGYAVRAYTKTRSRYTKDIGLAVREETELPRLRMMLERAGYAVRDRPHGLSGYRRVRGVSITVNAIVEDVESQERTISSFYPQVPLSFKAKVSSIEDLMILKTKLWRERDIVDTCLLIPESFDLIDMEQLRKRLHQKQFHSGFIGSMKKLLDLIGTKKFHDVWEDFMRRKIRKDEETELWRKLNELIGKIA